VFSDVTWNLDTGAHQCGQVRRVHLAPMGFGGYCPGTLAVRRFHGLVQHLFVSHLQALGQPVQHVAELVHPAALLARLRMNLAQSCPEPRFAPSTLGSQWRLSVRAQWDGAATGQPTSEVGFLQPVVPQRPRGRWYDDTPLCAFTSQTLTFLPYR
jgi:hypothetical protein